MDRLPYEVCQEYYNQLGINFKDYNEYQYEVVLGNDRFPLIIGGERGGKSYVTAALLVPHIDLLPEIRRERFYDQDGNLLFNWKDRTQRPMQPDFVLFGPNYAEPEVEFEYLEEFLNQLNIVARVSKPQQGRWTLITKAGVVVQTWSTENSMSIRAIDLEGAAAVEAGAMTKDAIERIQGRISAKKGFLIYNGTMENANRWYMDFAQQGERENRYGVKTYRIPSWANKHEFPEGRNDPEIKRLEKFYPEDIFKVRVAAEPVEPQARVIREFTKEHIKKMNIPRDEKGRINAKIEVWIDPGYLPSAYAVLWVAIWDNGEDGKMFYVFDEIYEREKQTDDIIDMVKVHKFYRFLEPNGMIIDISSKRHADGNEPAIEIWRRKTRIKNPKFHYWHQNALIERIRTSAKGNQVFIHPNCTGLIAELGLGDHPIYQDMTAWSYPTDKSGIIVSDKPKDEHNHACKALGYGLLDHLGIVERIGARPKSRNRIRENRRTATNMFLHKPVHKKLFSRRR